MVGKGGRGGGGADLVSVSDTTESGGVDTARRRVATDDGGGYGHGRRQGPARRVNCRCGGRRYRRSRPATRLAAGRTRHKPRGRHRRGLFCRSWMAHGVVRDGRCHRHRRDGHWRNGGCSSCGLLSWQVYQRSRRLQWRPLWGPRPSPRARRGRCRWRWVGHPPLLGIGRRGGGAKDGTERSFDGYEGGMGTGDDWKRERGRGRGEGVRDGFCFTWESTGVAMLGD